jgi:hypothetical protein
MASIGNAWHIPNDAEPPGQSNMSFPLEDIGAATAVTLSNGNQFQGPGASGNQTQSGSAVMVRRAGDASWTPLVMHFQSGDRNNKYFAATIPLGAFEDGKLVQYYFKIDYTDHANTLGVRLGLSENQTGIERFSSLFRGSRRCPRRM